MEFIETKLFTKLVYSYLKDDEFMELQLFLTDNPETGDIIQGTGGLRKIRWHSKGKGRRGGARIIYARHVPAHKILLLTIYSKNEVTDLSVGERKILRQIAEEWKNV